jgi:hypothetical protein
MMLGSPRGSLENLEHELLAVRRIRDALDGRPA